MPKPKRIAASDVDNGMFLLLGTQKYHIDLTGTLGDGKVFIGAGPVDGDPWSYITIQMLPAALIDVYNK